MRPSGYRCHFDTVGNLQQVFWTGLLWILVVAVAHLDRPRQSDKAWCEWSALVRAGVD